MKTLELSDLENISGGDFLDFWNKEGKYIFYTVISFEVVAAVSLLAGIASMAYWYNCKLSF